MISVVIAANGQEMALAETLAALVPAAADGFVREVVVVAEAGPSEGTRLVADAVGCVIVEGDARAGLEAARSDWVLVMAPGVRLESDWFREAGVMMQRLQRAGGRPVAMLFRGAVDDYGWRARLREIVLKLSRGRRRRQAMLAPRRALLEGGRLGSHALRARAFTGGVGTAG